MIHVLVYMWFRTLLICVAFDAIDVSYMRMLYVVLCLVIVANVNVTITQLREL